MRLLLSLLISLLAAAGADDTPGNAVACTGTCPCGLDPPDWSAALPWLPVSNASWCPLGCATASGGPDTSGAYVVDVAGSVCNAFEAWSGAAQRFLEPYGCPLPAYWHLSLRWFSPCFNSTSLALSEQVDCTTCVLPTVPSPPPPGAPAPLAAPPQQTARMVNATLCLDAGDAANATVVAAMLSAALGVAETDISLSPADPMLCANQTAPPPPAAPVPPAPGPLASEALPVQPNGRADTNSTLAIAVTVTAPDDATARIISAAVARLATPAGRDELASVLHPSPAQRSWGISPMAALPVSSPPPPVGILAPKAKGDVGRRLLPVRILIAVLVSVPICCLLPLYLLCIAAWRAAQHSTCIVGIRGRMCDGASPGDREQLARCLHALVNAWAHTQLTTPHIKAMMLRMQTAQEADRHVPWLWPAALTAPSFIAHQRTFLDRHGSLSTVDEDVEKVGGGSLVPEAMDFQAVWELQAVFRWPRTARLWRSAVQGGSITQDLDTHVREVIDAALVAQLDCGSDDDDSAQGGDAQSVATVLGQSWSPQLPTLLAMPPQLDVSVVLLSHRSPPAAAGEDEVLLGQPLRRLSRRRTLYVAPHDGQLDSFPLAPC